MTTKDNNWHDEHLKTALKHAPDNHVQASEQVRNQVLTYAQQAINMQPSGLSRLKNWLFKDHFANAQWASLTGVAAMLLVAVLLWRQHPEDTVWISATPQGTSENSPPSAEMPAKTEGEISQNATPADMPASPAPIEAQRDSSLPSAPIVAEDLSANQQTLEAKKLDLSASKKARLKESASTEPVGQLNHAQSDSDKKELPKLIKNENAQAEATATEAPVAAMAAPAPAIVAKPTLVETTDETFNKQKSIVPSIADKKRESTSISADIRHNNTAPINQETNSTHILESAALSNALVEQGGQTIAELDIEVGTFRLLQVKPQQDSLTKKIHECKQSSTAKTVDAQTGYRIEILVPCERAETLIKAVETYNQTMRNWYLQHKN